MMVYSQLLWQAWVDGLKLRFPVDPLYVIMKMLCRHAPCLFSTFVFTNSLVLISSIAKMHIG
jgi:hypothetical protein